MIATSMYRFPIIQLANLMGLMKSMPYFMKGLVDRVVIRQAILANDRFLIHW
jgi:phage-related protein